MSDHSPSPADKESYQQFTFHTRPQGQGQGLDFEETQDPNNPQSPSAHVTGQQAAGRSRSRSPNTTRFRDYSLHLESPDARVRRPATAHRSRPLGVGVERTARTRLVFESPDRPAAAAAVGRSSSSLPVPSQQIEEVRGFPLWFNIKYDDDEAIYTFRLLDDFQRGDLRLLVE